MAKHHVTRKEAQAVIDFAGYVLHELGLPAWQICVMDEPSDEDAFADIRTIEGRWVAELRLCSTWEQVDYDERRQTVVHEVLHLLHYSVNHVIEDASDLMHDHEWEGLNRRYHRATEYMVDHLARFLDSHSDLRTRWDRVHGK